MATVTEEALVSEIQRLKRERDAVILAHNYQRPEVQDIADFVGDSLALSRQAARTAARVIVFCGVHFMAETAAIICPDKTVLLPDPQAGCSLAGTVAAADIRRWRAEHPDGIVVAYINTSAAVKAEVDYCCTSGNAVNVIRAIPADRPLLFVPDMFLGHYLKTVTGRQMDIWLGECHVHAQLTPDQVTQRAMLFDDAEMLIHPECGCVSSVLYMLGEGDLAPARAQVLSTEGMVRRAVESPQRRFLVATEVGILHRMQKLAPDKEFIPLNPAAQCQYMKLTTLEKVHRCLTELQVPVTVDPDIAARARRAIDRMLEIG